jgi:hypothetical protein
MTNAVKPSVGEQAEIRNVVRRNRDRWRRASRTDRVAETLTQGTWQPPGLVRRAWRKAAAIGNHPPGLDAFDAVAAVITLAIFVWILAEMVSL